MKIKEYRKKTKKKILKKKNYLNKQQLPETSCMLHSFNQPNVLL